MVAAQAQRLLADPRSQDMLMDFMGSWLGLEKLYTTVKDDSVYMLTDTLRGEMASETRGLILDTFQNGGTFSDLLTADHSFLNQDLAQFYGFDTTGLGSTFTRVQYPGGTSRDGGILAHASILTGFARADISSPTQRGHLVRTRLLCQYIYPPGASLDTTFHPDPTPTTTRAHYENAHAHGDCVGCHKQMDPIGYGFEHYDAFGRWRDTENGYPIDSRRRSTPPTPPTGTSTSTASPRSRLIWPATPISRPAWCEPGRSTPTAARPGCRTAAPIRRFARRRRRAAT